MPSRTGYNDFKKAQLINKIQFDASEAEMRRKRDRARREAYKNSPQGIAEQQRRDAIQEQTRAKEQEIQNEIDSLNAVLSTMVVDLEASIKEDIKNSSVEDVLEKYKNELAVLDAKSERLATLMKPKYPGYKFSHFAKLYYKLSLIDPKFILKAPAKTFVATQAEKSGTASFNLSTFENEDLTKLHKRLVKEDKTISADEHFACYYAKYFKEEFKNLKQLRDVKSCLGKYPELYPNVCQSFKNQLNAKNEMPSLLAKAPVIIKYMTQDEIETLANNQLKLIASAVMKDPEILDYLDEDFFTRHDYRICFTNFPKAKIRQTLGDKVKRHVRLQAFINSRKEDRSLDSSLNF